MTVSAENHPMKYNAALPRPMPGVNIANFIRPEMVVANDVGYFQIQGIVVTDSFDKLMNTDYYNAGGEKYVRSEPTTGEDLRASAGEIDRRVQSLIGKSRSDVRSHVGGDAESPSAPQKEGSVKPDLRDGYEIQEKESGRPDRRSELSSGSLRRDQSHGGRTPEVQTLPEIVTERRAYLDSGIDRVNNLRDAAEVAGGLSKNAQENLLAIVSDKDGKVLSVVRLGLGGIEYVSPNYHLVAGRALNTPGAAKLYLAHNHPSGALVLSGPDKIVSEKVRNLMHGTDVSYEGLAVVTDKGFAVETSPGRGTFTSRPENIRIPIEERVFEKHGDNLKHLEDPYVAQSLAKEMGPGLMLADLHHRFVGFIPEKINLINGDYKAIRGRLQAEILREAEKRNAVSFVVMSPDRKISLAEEQNLNRFAKASGLGFVHIYEKGDYPKVMKGRDPAPFDEKGWKAMRFLSVGGSLVGGMAAGGKKNDDNED